MATFDLTSVLLADPAEEHTGWGHAFLNDEKPAHRNVVSVELGNDEVRAQYAARHCNRRSSRRIAARCHEWRQ